MTDRESFSVQTASERATDATGPHVGRGPIPWGQAARATAELSREAFLVVVPGAGHFPWTEVPGSVRSALRRLVG